MHRRCLRHSGGGHSRNRRLNPDFKNTNLKHRKNKKPAHATERLVTACTESGCEMAVSDYYRIVGRKKLIKGDIAEGGLILRNEYVGCMFLTDNVSKGLWSPFTG